MTPRGIRNNNPMNVTSIATQHFVGELVPDFDDFCTFDSPLHGIRAGALVLLTYFLIHDINTIRGAITRWSATDQAPYIAFVSKLAGVQADQVIDFFNPTILFLIVRAIIFFENGENPYSGIQIKVAIAQAIGGTP